MHAVCPDCKRPGAQVQGHSSYTGMIHLGCGNCGIIRVTPNQLKEDDFAYRWEIFIQTFDREVGVTKFLEGIIEGIALRIERLIDECRRYY